MGIPPGSDDVVVGLVGVYDAEGTLLGEVAYWVGARLGRAHCALCDVTHGMFTERADWRAARDTLPAPFATYHLDDMPAEVRECAGDLAPVVLARATGGMRLQLGPSELDACRGSPTRLVELLHRTVDHLGLAWPTVP